MKNLNFKKLTWLTIFSIAMGYLETSVVIYLRYLYYPDGFSFPLVPMDIDIAIFEFFREVATIIMLIGVGIFLGKNGIQKFAYFIYSFAIWDIFYYVFLYVTLGWPSSLFTWDLLFLVPIPWVGPVIGPLIISGLMIFLSLGLLKFPGEQRRILNLWQWGLLIVGSVIVILSWTIDYAKHITQGSSIWQLTEQQLIRLTSEYIPQEVYWGTFTVGSLLIFMAILMVYFRNFPKREMKEIPNGTYN